MVSCYNCEKTQGLIVETAMGNICESCFMDQCGVCGAIDSWTQDTPASNPYWECEQGCAEHVFCSACGYAL